MSRGTNGRRYDERLAHTGDHVVRGRAIRRADPYREPDARINNYYGGSDLAGWFENVPNFGRVVYDDVYAGIDVAFYGQGSELEFDFLVDAGIDPEQARMTFAGATALRVDEEGRLVVETAAGHLHFKRPFAYQEIAGERRAVEAAYVVALDGSVILDIGERLPDLPLVIDPVVTFSTYLGGSGLDSVRGVVPDGLGNVFVTGYANTSIQNGTFPGLSDAVFEGSGDQSTFLAKIDTATGSLQSLTVIRGFFFLQGATSLATAPDGTVWMTGTVGENIGSSVVFPERNSLPGLPRGQNDDAFVAHFSSAGQLLFADAFGGAGDEIGTDLDVDASGNVIVVGRTASDNFPTTTGALDTGRSGSTDAFVVKLSSNGAALTYASYLGGSGDEGSSYIGGPEDDVLIGVAVDSAGNALVVGRTTSTNFPTTPGAFQTVLAGGADGFLAKLNSTGSQLLFATYLGGSSETISPMSPFLPTAGRW